MDPQLKDNLDKCAAKKTWSERTNRENYSREATDNGDAYDDGFEDGRITLAREILKQFGSED